MKDPNQPSFDSSHGKVEEQGPWPFITRRVFILADQTERIWSSRQHRKGLLIRAAVEGVRFAPKLLKSLWMPHRLNWWMAMLFAIGALFFVIAGVLSLKPALAQALSLDSTQVNSLFFIGSIPFTIAAYLQLFQAANAGDPTQFDQDKDKSTQRFRIFGWRPGNVGWLSSALQFIGTILFNVNTLDAMLPSLDWLQEDLVVWIPDIAGSILFLASGYLAFIETCHGHWGWKPGSISWWVVFINLLGCIGFMIAAVPAVAMPGAPVSWMVNMSIVFTIIGAAAFLVGSLLMLPEAVIEE